MRYFFHLILDGELSADDTGTEFPDAVSARRDALSTLCDMTAERIAELTPPSSMSIRITAEDGQHLGVLSLTFEEVPPDWSTPTA
jgi:hypothetical protein